VLGKRGVDTDYGFIKYAFCNPNENAREFFWNDIVQEIQPKPFDPELPEVEDPLPALPIYYDNLQTSVWDRYELYVLSSIATSSDKNSYLGHTRGSEYIPIKYYRIDSDDKEFWVEFYSTRDHRIIVDDLERWSEFHMEVIFMYSTSAML
jgi:hypothetical protein